MANVDQLFSHADRERVNQAVREAESSTSAEILPVVAGSSGRYDRPEDIVGLWCAAIALVVVWMVYPASDVEPGNWAAPSAMWQIVALLVAMVAGFIAGAAIATRVDGLKRLFTPRVQMSEEVFGRARQVFFDSRVHHTEGSSGVLLYVSLFERMAAVVCDQAILEKLGQSRIDALCRELTDRLQEESATEAICETILTVGKQLAPLLPRAADDVNEIPDALVVLN